MTRWLRALVVGLALLMAVSCSDGDDDTSADRATTTGDTSASSTTSTAAASTTTSTTTAAEGPTEWVAITQDLYNRLHELRVQPDPAAVTTVVDLACSCYSSELSTVEFFAAEGLRYESRPNQVLSVIVTGEQPEVRLTFLQVEVLPSAVRLYNRDGSLYQETPAPPQGLVNLAVSPSGPNGEWRIHDEVNVG